MDDREDEVLEEEVFKASAEGIILPLECSQCEGLFFGYWNETVCPDCLANESILSKLLTRTEPDVEEDDEAKFFEYKCIEYTKGWLSTKVELNVNTPCKTWLETLHEVMVKHGCMKPDGKGGWLYNYPESLGDYMRLLTIIAAERINPFFQVCVIVKFWRTEYKYVKLTIYEDGRYKRLLHAGPWSKLISWGKDEVEVHFEPFHPVAFQYSQPDNKGFRAMIDVWKNTKEGGVDALIQLALDEVHGKD